LGVRFDANRIGEFYLLRDIADAVELGADLVLIVLGEIGCEIDPSHLLALDTFRKVLARLTSL
jgi:hypothetical protein